MNLYEINNEILNCIDEETGEIIDEERLTELQMAEEEKIENIALWIKNLKAEAEALKNEKEAFDKRKKSAENKAESLSRYLTNYLRGNKFKTERVAISFRKSASLEIEKTDTIPYDYLEFEPKVKKADLKKAIQDGLEVDGCYIVEKQNIQIK